MSRRSLKINKRKGMLIAPLGNFAEEVYEDLKVKHVMQQLKNQLVFSAIILGGVLSIQDRRRVSFQNLLLSR